MFHGVVLCLIMITRRMTRMNDFIKNLRIFRTGKKMSQTDVAIACKVSLTTYQLWERGVTEPKPENMEKLIKLFKE